MNGSTVKNIILLVAVVIMLPCSAFAIPPHDASVSPDYVCNTCHSAHREKGNVGYNNICLNCHRPGRASNIAGSSVITPFIRSDMAVVSGPSQGVLEAGKTKSSHRWEGSDLNPRAGALRPTNKILNGSGATGPDSTATNFLNNLYCARCHTVHGVGATPTSVTAPFIRALNDSDQMCLDCHRPRNQTSADLGSHPVNVDYTAIAISKPSQFFNPPRNANPANPTAAMKLVNNKVLCSTCHSVHFADSNSRTFDNVSSAVFGRLSSSKGYLLRTDLKGVDATDRNICTNCHKTVEDDPNAILKSHNSASKLQNVQCADCHGGHVDEADATTPNVKLIKRYMNLSSSAGRYAAVRNAKVMYQFTSAARKNYNKDTFGVCVACHATLPTSVSQHTSTDARVCVQCHTHKQGFSADCTTCHGFPPSQNVVGGPNGYAAGYVGVNEATSPHQSHASGKTTNSYYSYTCNECHKGYSHNTGTFQDVFKNHTGILAGPTASYTGPPSRTCNNVYCHSNGSPAGSPTVYVPVSWNSLKDSIIGTAGECSACHAAAPATNAHTKHLSYSYECSKCHAATVNQAGAILADAKKAGGTHTNKVKDVLFSGTVGSSTLSGTNCSAVYCHTNGKGTPAIIAPVWTNPATGACGACHATSTINTGAHQAHLTFTYGPVLHNDGEPASCNNCHTYPNGHVNGSVEGASLAGCTLNCHKNGVAPATWTTGRVGITCESCHAGNVSVIKGVSAPDKSLAPTTGHGKPSGANQTCVACHNNTMAHIDGSLTVFRTTSGVRNFRLNSQFIGTLNTECNYCHNSSIRMPLAKFRNMSTHFKKIGVKGQPQNMECYQCHELHGTTNLSMIRTKIAYINSTSWDISFADRTNGQINQVNNRGLCQVCHTVTKYYKAGVPETGHPTDNCFNCHPHNGAGGAFKPSGSCDACHGYPPVPQSAVKGPDNPLLHKGTFGTYNNYTNARFQDYTGGGGAHLNHVPTYAKATDGWQHCAICHTGGNVNNTAAHRTQMPLNQHISNVTINVDQRVNFNNSLQVIYSGARLVDPPAVNRTGSCVNVGCHFQPTPRWSNRR